MIGLLGEVFLSFLAQLMPGWDMAIKPVRDTHSLSSTTSQRKSAGKEEQWWHRYGPLSTIDPEVIISCLIVMILF